MDIKKFPIVLAMIQPEPLPGTYRHNGMPFQDIIEEASKEVAMLKENKFDGYIIQNRNDAPIKQTVGADTVAYLSILSKELKQRFPEMIQGILINWDGVASLAVADAVGSDFIRVEHTYTGVEVGYAGLMEAQCVEICALKKRIGSKVPVYADVQEIHYEQIGGKTIPDAAWDSVMNAFADGLFLGGKSSEESIEIIKAVRKRLPDIPILLSSGATKDNIAEILQYYDGVSVGTWVKNGNMKNPIDPIRAKQFMDEVKKGKALRK